MALRRTSSLRSLLSARLYQPSSGSIIRRDHEEKWASVLLAIFLIRGLTIPFMISTARLYSRVAVSRILQRQKNYLESKDQGRDPATVARIQREHDDMVKEFKICKYPYLFAVPYICAIPFLLECMDTAVQEMTMNVPSFKTGGALWFTDLTSPDAFYILPILTGLIFWIGVEEVTYNAI